MVTPGKMTALPAALPPDTTAVKRVLEAVLRLARDRHPDVQAGVFGADMAVSLVNDGPVTLVLDSRDPE